MMIKKLTELSKEIYEANCEKGFHDKRQEIGTLLMLVVSELGEAIDAHRHGNFSNACLKALHGWKTDDDFRLAYEKLVKGTFEEEIADAIIRLLDLSGTLCIDIGSHIYAKLRYNTTRPYKHGKKY